MECYKFVNGGFKCVVDPTDVGASKGVAGVEEAIFLAGYTIHVCSSESDATGPEISIYETENRSQPRYYIDVMGTHKGIATFVADDFPSLLATLKELAPLTSLLGLAQAAAMRAFDKAESFASARG